jgi:uncharacterized membrane protein YgdD (TMEM256/DUF423 family)
VLVPAFAGSLGHFESHILDNRPTSFGMSWWHWGIGASLIHTLYVLALCCTLIEIFLLNYRKLPLTCPTPGFRDNLLMLCLIQLCGIIFFTTVGARLERWMLPEPARFLLVPLIMGLAWYWNRKRLAAARIEGELEEGLVFENTVPRAVERLNIFGGA